MGQKAPLPSRLNICLIANKFPILGRAADHGFLWPIAKGMAELGHRVTILATKNPLGQAELEKDNVRAFFLYEGFPNYSNLGFQDAVKEKFAELHAETPFHIVHSIDSSGRKIGLNKKYYRVGLAYDVEATQMSQIFSILGMSQETVGSLLSTSFAVAYKFLTTFYGEDRKLLKSADGVFVTSPLQRIILERYYLYPDSRTFTVPYGIDLGDLSPREKSKNLKSQLGLPEDCKVAVTITDMSEFVEIKNLLRAFEKVAIKKPNSRLIIVGNGPMWKQVEYEMLNLALGNKVVMTGAIKNVEIPDYISLADVYINISSRTTGFEPSMLEAMAQGKIIIGSEISPISTIVDDGIDGFLIRPADHLSISSLLIEIFNGALSPSGIGKNARQKVLQLFDTNQMVNNTVEAYFNILKRTSYYLRAS